MAALGFLPLFIFFSLSQAVKFFSNSTVPAGISNGCSSALLADINCSKSVIALNIGVYYPKPDLERICTSTCSSALSTYHASILASCSADTWEGFDDEVLPVAMISEMIRYHYNGTCLKDGTRFCNNVAAAYSVSLDPDAAAAPGGLPASGNYGGLVISDPCDLCLVKSLQFQAGSPYYNGLDLQSSSIYQSRTSSCGITNAPLTTTPLSIVTPTTSVIATPTCAGSTYTIKATDDCYKISISEGIGTSWLLSDNFLTTGCANFPTSGTLCIVNTCDVYTVKTGDTCSLIERAQGITESQLRSWNPSINAGCYNLKRMVGDSICISSPGTPYVSPPSTTLQPSIPITAAPIPTDVAEGTNTYCGTYYKAILGDYCNLIVMKFAISLDDFLFLNPAINGNCTNLFAEESYCVKPVGDINTYSGKPGYQTFTVSLTSLVGDPATNLPTVRWSSPTATTTQIPLATDTRDDCSYYFLGDEFQQSLTGSNWISHCEIAAAVMDVTLEDLQTWNPALSNVTANCNFDLRVRYCGKYYSGERPPPVIEGSTLPTRPNTTPNCTYFVDVNAEGGPDCAYILESFDITIAQFFRWNPSVGNDCSGLWAGYKYCVASNEIVTPTGSGTPTSTPSPTSSNTPPGPTQEGQPINCNKWHVAVAGDDCSLVENQYFITHTQFISWNPAVSQDCVSGFWGTYAYCVGTTDTISSTRPITTPPPPPTPITAPEPNQANNAISTCNKFAQAQDGDWCARFAERNVVSLANLYAWNAVLGADGSGCGGSFWKDYWYCVGVSS